MQRVATNERAGVGSRRVAVSSAALRLMIASAVMALMMSTSPALGDESAASSERGVTSSESRPLGRPRVAKEPAESSAEGTKQSSAGGAGMARTAAALGGVLVLIAGLGYGARWSARWMASRQGGLSLALGAGGRAPSGILHVLGRYPLARGLTLVLLKVDRRVLLLSQSGGRRSGLAMTTLCEITDPEEVASIVSKSSDAMGEAMAAKFQAFLSRSDGEIESALGGGKPAEPAATSGRAKVERTSPAVAVGQMLGLGGRAKATSPVALAPAAPAAARAIPRVAAPVAASPKVTATRTPRQSIEAKPAKAPADAAEELRSRLAAMQQPTGGGAERRAATGVRNGRSAA